MIVVFAVLQYGRLVDWLIGFDQPHFNQSRLVHMSCIALVKLCLLLKN
jgi:hypothetical protein